MTSRKILIGILILGLAFMATPAAAATYKVTSWPDPYVPFFQNDQPNFQLDTSGGVARIHAAKTSDPSTGIKYGGLKTNFWLHGDFDVSVDWHNNRGGFDNNQQLELQVNGKSFLFYNIREFLDGQDEIKIWAGGVPFGYTATTAQEGNLRIKRVGAELFAYFSPTMGSPSNTPYYPFGWSSSASGEDVQISLVIQNNMNQSGPLDGYFDNLSIQADSFKNFKPRSNPALNLLLSD